MVLDLIENAYRYAALNPGFARAFEFLSMSDMKGLAVGKYEIDGDHIYAMVSRQPGRRKEDALLESHRKYIDIQFVLSGTDLMGWKPLSLCRQSLRGYDEQSDVEFFADTPDAWFPVESGSFAVFFPEDAHLPLISEGLIHKVVVKVAVA